MLLALIVLAAMPDWVPARWHSTDPKSLELLSGTPINCVLLDAPATDPALTREAAARGIATLALLHPGDDLRASAERAASLHMNGVVLQGDFESNAATGLRARVKLLPVIELPGLHHIRLESGEAITGTSQALWPAIEIEHGDSSLTGPTSSPWIDTSRGFLSFVRAATGARRNRMYCAYGSALRCRSRISRSG
jgi:hypothetical protein